MKTGIAHWRRTLTCALAFAALAAGVSAPATADTVQTLNVAGISERVSILTPAQDLADVYIPPQTSPISYCGSLGCGPIGTPELDLSVGVDRAYEFVATLTKQAGSYAKLAAVDCSTLNAAKTNGAGIAASGMSSGTQLWVTLNELVFNSDGTVTVTKILDQEVVGTTDSPEPEFNLSFCF